MARERYNLYIKLGLLGPLRTVDDWKIIYLQGNTIH